MSEVPIFNNETLNYLCWRNKVRKEGEKNEVKKMSKERKRENEREKEGKKEEKKERIKLNHVLPV